MNYYSNTISEYHIMHKTIFLYLLTLHNLAESDVKKYFHNETSEYSRFYHYDIDTAKRQQIMQFNQKNKLNQPKVGSFYSFF